MDNCRPCTYCGVPTLFEDVDGDPVCVRDECMAIRDFHALCEERDGLGA